jgi:hypothetical protein
MNRYKCMCLRFLRARLEAWRAREGKAGRKAGLSSLPAPFGSCKVSQAAAGFLSGACGGYAITQCMTGVPVQRQKEGLGRREHAGRRPVLWRDQGGDGL